MRNEHPTLRQRLKLWYLRRFRRPGSIPTTLYRFQNGEPTYGPAIIRRQWAWIPEEGGRIGIVHWYEYG